MPVRLEHTQATDIAEILIKLDPKQTVDFINALQKLRITKAKYKKELKQDIYEILIGMKK